MKWSSDGVELKGTKDPFKIVSALNLCAIENKISGSNYYLLSNGNTPTISNVPSPIYENERLKKYKPPLDHHKQKSFVEFLQSNINIMQNSFDASDKFENGKVFQQNQCYHNSKGLFYLVNHLAKIGLISLNNKPQLVFGYIVNRIPYGTTIGGKVIENDSIFLHDWHIWNYVNDFLVDLTIFKSGNLIGLNNNIESWGSAEDHVFIFPPDGVEYYGDYHCDLARFEKKISEYFY